MALTRRRQRLRRADDYLRDGVRQVTGSAGLGKFLAAFFAVCCIGGALGGGNMFQANQATAQIVAVTGGDDSVFADLNWLVGVGFALAVGAVIIGGIKSIARVTEKIVPLMAAIYVAACLVVILGNLNQVPAAMGDIISGAFSAEGVAGGFVGALIVGFQRAAFSNEAGVGSASIAHSAVKTEEPATEGFVALLEPLIDTIIICTMTALAIVITGAWNDPDAAELVFKVIFCLFTVIGASLSLGPVIGFSDAAIFMMSIPNVIGLYILARVVRSEVRGHLGRVRTGEFARVD